MGDLIPNDAAHAPTWQELYQAALLELDPTKLLERIAAARSAVLDRIEDRFSTKSSDSERLALRNALDALTTLRMIAQRDIGEQGT